MDEENPFTPKPSALRKVLKIAAVLALFPLGVVVGGSMTGVPFGTDTRDMYETIKLIKSKHVGTPVTDDQLYYGAISGMVDSMGDQFSGFDDPKTAARMKQDMTGSFAGIGAEMGQKNGCPQVVAPMNDYPAAKAGVLAGDIITEVDGVATCGMSMYDVISKIRGEKGKPVKLTIHREGATSKLSITVVRDTVKTESVKTKPITVGDKTLLHVTISGFHEDTADLFAAAAKKALDERVAGMIVDLRNDPGGFLKSAEAVSCKWIPAGKPFMSMQRKGQAKDLQMCDGSPILSKMPTVVLLNKGSASASEITAGALQDYGAAHLIGEKSYGKGCGQDVVQFADGGQLRLTSFLWFTPKGRSINKFGITPDETVAASSPEDQKAGKDAQLERAVIYLTEGR